MRVVETVPSNMPAPTPNIPLSPSTNVATVQSTHVATLAQQDTKDTVAPTNTLTTITSNEPQSKCYTAQVCHFQF